MLYEVATVFSLTKDLQAAATNFITTNDSAYLTSLNASEALVFSKVSQLRTLTTGNVSQLPRIDSLQSYIQHEVDYLHYVIAIRTSDGLKPAITLSTSNEAKHVVSRIGEITNDIQQDEKLLLQEEGQSNDQSVRFLNRLSITMFTFMILFTLLLFGITRIYLIQQERYNHETEMWNAELVRANTALESFSYSVSHDLRSPVRSIIGFSKIINEKHGQNLSEKVRELFGHIENSSKRMNIIIDDLLVLAKSGTQQLHTETVDITSMFNHVWQTLLLSNPHHATMTIVELPTVLADSSMLEQVIVNLLSNAIKYSGKKENPLILIGYERQAEQVIFSVKDNGAGFDMKHYDRLFGAFQRLHTESEYEGIGVGLMLVKRIIERQGGKVWAEGKTDEGATFYFSLPTA